jgi:hypothetical protein
MTCCRPSAVIWREPRQEHEPRGWGDSPWARSEKDPALEAHELNQHLPVYVVVVSS